MKNKRTIFFVVAGAALILILAVILFNRQQKRYDWYETYDIKSKEPYGAFVAGELVKNYFPEKKFNVLNKALKETLPEGFRREKANYFFIGKEMMMDQEDVNALVSFVGQGNNAFISVSTFPWNLVANLVPDSCSYDGEGYVASMEDTSIDLNFYAAPEKREKNFRLQFIYKNAVFGYPWTCFDSAMFCGSISGERALALGYMGKNFVNYAKIRYGSGYFFLHTTPLVFTNYQLLKAENADYMARALSYLTPGDIYWDEFNKKPGNLNFNRDISESPLKYILSQQSLRWAWYITLGMLLLWALFFAKRKQRIIPVLQPVLNTSLEFIRTIGQLYYQQQNHHALAIHKMKLFQAFIRNRYFILANQPNDEIIKKISVKSQLPEDQVRAIFTQSLLVERNINLSSQDLIDFHQLLESFYKNCK